ncbi:MAG: Lrp/AsnC family transcriptional regulator [Thermoprotei archaeon]|nr:MAG: Lrp/AsnC family transcriptional regulator [Thermoprotei archaeon]
MAMAFVMVSTEIGAEKDVLAKLREVEGVVEAHIVYGVYDLIVKVKTEDQTKLKDIITKYIRKMDKVRSTLTMIVVEGFQK